MKRKIYMIMNIRATELVAIPATAIPMLAPLCRLRMRLIIDSGIPTSTRDMETMPINGIHAGDAHVLCP